MSATVEDADSSVGEGGMLSVVCSVDEVACDVSVAIVGVDDAVSSIVEEADADEVIVDRVVDPSVVDSIMEVEEETLLD